MKHSETNECRLELLSELSRMYVFTSAAHKLVLHQSVQVIVNTVRPVFESQQWPQAGCATHALH